MVTPYSLKGKTIAIFGLGRAGQSTVKALSDAEVNMIAWDDNESSREKTKLLAPEHLLSFQKPEDTDWSQVELLALSPGVPFTHPEPHPIVKLAQAASVPVICDIEILYRALPECNYIGITGTNGKSTTTVLIGHILKQANIVCEIGGNLGIPVLDLKQLEPKQTYVLELSSYQLDLLQDLRCDISVITNITPDHLDRHGDMEGYIKAKKRIYRHQGKEQVAIIHIDNERTKKLYSELVSEDQIGTIIPCSCDEIQENGIAIIDGTLSINCFGIHKTMELPPIKTLAGKHNAENMTVAIASALSQGIDIETIIDAIKTFPGLRHRLQYVGEKDNVTFINDSKATNAEAAAKALQAFDNIYWIAGGIAKDGGIKTLSPYFSRIKHAFLIGEAQDDFANELQSVVNNTKCNNLENAIDQAVAKAKSENQKAVILLSPACASFDQWPTFEARGDFFCEKIEALL